MIGGRPRGAAARAYRTAPGQRRRTPWRAARYCVVDLETTGLDPRRDEIVAWAAVPVDDGRVVLGGTVEGLVHPRRGVAAATVRVHGLRAADLAGAPDLAPATEALLTAMTGRVLVVHSARVERAFLGPALARRGVRLSAPVLDTAVLGRLWMWYDGQPVPRFLDLGRLAETLGLPVHRPHEASGDALTTAQAFVALATRLERHGPETVGTLAAALPRLGVAGPTGAPRC